MKIIFIGSLVKTARLAFSANIVESVKEEDSFVEIPVGTAEHLWEF